MAKPIGKDDFVWYVAYGSNLYAHRFQEYLNRIHYQGIFPINKPYAIPYDIYFDRYSSRWKGGVAFLNPLKSGFAYGRAYRLTYDEFFKVKAEEGIYPVEVVLPDLDGYPAFTFTQSQHEGRSIPTQAYVKVIYLGLKETYPHLDAQTLLSYLASKAKVNLDPHL